MEHDLELAPRSLSRRCGRRAALPPPPVPKPREAPAKILVSASLRVALLDQITAQAVTQAFASNPLGVSAMGLRAHRSQGWGPPTPGRDSAIRSSHEHIVRGKSTCGHTHDSDY